jgi:hypothetical protein
MLNQSGRVRGTPFFLRANFRGAPGNFVMRPEANFGFGNALAAFVSLRRAGGAPVPPCAWKNQTPPMKTSDICQTFHLCETVSVPSQTVLPPENSPVF